MPYGFLDIAITPSVRAVQTAMGSDGLWRDFSGHREFKHFGPDEIAFVSSRDSFYLASVSESGWPYVQHRGGPEGFLKVIDARTLAFADYRGNRQYISTGNVMADGRVCLFLMDYPQRARLKIYARAAIVPLDADAALTTAVSDTTYRGRPERIYRLTLEAFDWNCSQHIVPRYRAPDIEAAVEPLRERLAALETENAALRTQLAGQRAPD
jgi:uncharacterized protein